MKFRKRFHRYCVMSVIMAFMGSQVMAQTPSMEAPASSLPAQGAGSESMQLAAAIGIVKPKTETPPDPGTADEAAPGEGPEPQAGPPAVEEAETAAETTGKGISKLAIGAGIGLAALLAAVAGGGGGGSSTPPSHSAP